MNEYSDDLNEDNRISQRAFQLSCEKHISRLWERYSGLGASDADILVTLIESARVVMLRRKTFQRLRQLRERSKAAA
jgi:hypothetical protein